MTRSRAAMVALLVSACQHVEQVHLEFAEGERATRGMNCPEALTSNPVEWVAKRSTGAGKMFRPNLVIDFISIETVDCQPRQLSSWCENHECRPDLARRVCFSVGITEDLTNGLAAHIALGEALWNLSAPVTDDAPDGIVIVRAVATAEPCADVLGKPGFECEHLLGCTHSCPVDLGSGGDVVLDLGIGHEGCLSTDPTCSCEADMNWCASESLRQASACPVLP